MIRIEDIFEGLFVHDSRMKVNSIQPQGFETIIDYDYSGVNYYLRAEHEEKVGMYTIKVYSDGTGSYADFRFGGFSGDICSKAYALEDKVQAIVWFMADF